MSKYRSGIWAGAVIFLLALFAFVLSLSYSYSGALGPGPGFFPTWLSGILMALSIWYIYESVKGKNTSSESWPTGQSLKHILFIIISLVLFVILFTLFGFLLAGFIFLAILFYKEYRWYTTLLMSAGITGFIYWMFNSVLKVYLPLGGILF
ncbi:tripartite tricarboxylate transporter TctB family protein [Niallia endozanthoxylica]|uniref:Tripartite tricarboxylate transporter TctB family protein n=1 Tax=Niallia endozanthoxylica TaxID=2036016 RepID=A0A5J5I594_9BACI|nr:tripartite tricarboxylate transporter TctB family protein [Niallia endozanthoxylica]KAA9031664.1 tripartite tricarboxylate transporter TctB family protein [Niallia endozanthoxylica]